MISGTTVIHGLFTDNQHRFGDYAAIQVWCGDVTYSVPGVQGGHGCLNEPRVCLEY
ncbi:protein of unknown function (plasmid) [Escherichia coli]|nr:protein of unknown function [Escherichia coli]